MTMRLLSIRACLSLAPLCLLSACGGLQIYHHVIYQSRVAQDCKSDGDHSGKVWCVDINMYGEACETSDGGVIPEGKLVDLWVDNSKGPHWMSPVVGFDHAWDPGTDPFPCWKYANSVTRAYVNFNLNTAVPKIEKVVTAKLTWDPSTKRTGSKQPSNQPPHCLKKLYEATGPWKSHATPGNLITDQLDQPSVATSILITQVVQKWVAAGGNQFGLFFTATDESMSNEKENNFCETTLNSLQLEVTYLGKEETFPH